MKCTYLFIISLLYNLFAHTVTSRSKYLIHILGVVPFYIIFFLWCISFDSNLTNTANCLSNIHLSAFCLYPSKQNPVYSRVTSPLQDCVLLKRSLLSQGCGSWSVQCNHSSAIPQIYLKMVWGSDLWDNSGQWDVRQVCCGPFGKVPSDNRGTRKKGSLVLWVPFYLYVTPNTTEAILWHWGRLAFGWGQHWDQHSRKIEGTQFLMSFWSLWSCLS